MSFANETSDQYANQLQAGEGNVIPVLPIVWTTNTPSSAFTVSVIGNSYNVRFAVQPGAYTASGSMEDANSHTGNWTFTLTVLTEYPSPATSVIPVVPSQPITPLGLEVLILFQINPA